MEQMIAALKKDKLRIYYRSPLPWIPESLCELVTNIQLFAFCDASFGSMRNSGSIESALVVVGRVEPRNGDLSCQGCYIESCARRIVRVCRSSLGADAVALGNCADLSIWIRVLLLEMITGCFNKELVDPSAHFKLLIPFGQAPAAEAVFSEIFGSTPKAVKMFDMRESAMQSNDFEKEVLSIPQNTCLLQHRCKLLVMTDSYNCYSSILPGSPKNSEKGINIQLSYIRDISEILALTFIDKILTLRIVLQNQMMETTGSCTRFCVLDALGLDFWGERK